VTFPMTLFSCYYLLQLTNPAPRDSLSSLNRDMTHQPDSARFQTLFEPALRAYERKAGVSLTQHPLAIKLQNCHSVEAITGLFQDQARAFSDFQGSDKVMKSIKTTVSILSKLSSAASLADAFGMVCRQELAANFMSLTVCLQTPAKAIQACLAILLDVRAHSPVHVKTVWKHPCDAGGQGHNIQL